MTNETKDAIKTTFMELLNRKPLNKITVTEICALADVNRSTFYAYYTDIFDLHRKILKEFYEIQRGYINAGGGDF